MINVLTSHGYEIICKNVHARPGFPFEDWYVHPDLVDMKVANQFKCNETTWQDIYDKLNTTTITR